MNNEWIDDSLSVPEKLLEVQARWGGTDEELNQFLHRYFVACCRAIWPLLPQEDSRRGVEVAERFVEGRATIEEASEIDWYVEAAAFTFDSNIRPEYVQHLIDVGRAIPFTELQQIVPSIDTASRETIRDLLARAAFFVDFTLWFGGKDLILPPADYYPFLSARVLDDMVDKYLYSPPEEPISPTPPN